MMHYFLKFGWILLSLSVALKAYGSALTYDLNVSGYIYYADGLGRLPIGLIDALKNDLKINFVQTRPWGMNLQNVNEDVKAILLNEDRSPGNVGIFQDILWYQFGAPPWIDAPLSKIRIAYSMLESSKIPIEWVWILNNHFDAVVVPDPYLIEVYRNSGVALPIFELPSGIYLDRFLQQPQRTGAHRPFIFGTTVGLGERKNHQLLIRAFAEVFGNSDQVILKINGRQGDQFSNLQALIQNYGLRNVYLTANLLEESDYFDYLNSFDCFVNISKGEGYSICPREAMALGIPCILSNNTAQMTLCKSGFVRAVPSEIAEKALYPGAFDQDHDCGCNYNCSIEDVKNALRDVYNNYSFYLIKADQSREWVKRYQWGKLKGYFLSLIKPKQVVLGDKDEITEEYLMTNSVALYNKYLEIKQSQ